MQMNKKNKEVKYDTNLVDVILKLHDEKKSRNIMPVHVTKKELVSEMCKQMESELKYLKQEGVIDEFNTLNDIAYVVN